MTEQKPTVQQIQPSHKNRAPGCFAHAMNGKRHHNPVFKRRLPDRSQAPHIVDRTVAPGPIWTIQACRSNAACPRHSARYGATPSGGWLCADGAEWRASVASMDIGLLRTFFHTAPLVCANPPRTAPQRSWTSSGTRSAPVPSPPAQVRRATRHCGGPPVSRHNRGHGAQRLSGRLIGTAADQPYQT